METHGDAMRRTMVWLLSLIALILSGWALQAMGGVLVPVVLGVFVTLLVYPVDRWLVDALPKKLYWLGHVGAMLVVIATGVLFIAALMLAAQQTVAQAPFSQEDLTGLLDKLSVPTEADSDAKATPLREAASGLIDSAAGWASAFATGALGAMGAVVSGAVIVLFFTLLLLLETPHWGDKISEIVTRSTQQDTRDVLNRIAAQMRRYLLTRAAVGLATGVLYAAWVALFGLDLLIVWFLLAFLLNFIPTFGSLVAGAIPAIYAFTQLEFWPAFAVGAGLFVIEQVMGNFVDPRVQGRQLSISPLIILLSLLFWGWIWGIAGAILAVPITISMLICFAYVPKLRPAALLLSNEHSFDALDRMVGDC